MKLLELFAGSRSVGKEAETLGIEVFSVDKFIEADMDWVGGVEELTIEFILDRFGQPDIIWASPPCTAWTKAGWFNHWDTRIYRISKRFIAKTQFANESVEMVRKTIEIFSWFPSAKFYMENPDGMLQFHPVIDYFKVHSLKAAKRLVTYCQYGDNVRKPTNIWTNDPNWKPRPACKRGERCHMASPMGTQRGILSKRGNYERSKIPPELCREVLLSAMGEARYPLRAKQGVFFN